MPHVDDVCPRYKSKSLQKIDDNVFLVVGTLKTSKMVKGNKNMIILLHNKRELTLINPIRLEDEGEAEILKLGKIQRLIRLAPRQGMEHDKYYLQKYPSIRRWAPAASHDPTLPVHRILAGDDNAILPATHVFCFQTTAQPECALVLLQDYVGNLLVTAEAFQAHRDNPYINLAARAQLTAKGMMAKDVVIPSSWLKQMQTKDKGNLRDDLESLLRLDFDRLVATTGVMVHQKAKEKAVLAVEHSLPVW